MGQDSAPTSDVAKNALKKMLEIKNIKETSLITADAIATLDLYKREDGTISVSQKAKSLRE